MTKRERERERGGGGGEGRWKNYLITFWIEKLLNRWGSR